MQLSQKTKIALTIAVSSMLGACNEAFDSGPVVEFSCSYYDDFEPGVYIVPEEFTDGNHVTPPITDEDGEILAPALVGNYLYKDERYVIIREPTAELVDIFDTTKVFQDLLDGKPIEYHVCPSTRGKITDLSDFGKLTYAERYGDLLINNGQTERVSILYRDILTAQRENITTFAFGGDGFTFDNGPVFILQLLIDLPNLTNLTDFVKNNFLQSHYLDNDNMWTKLISKASQTDGMFENIDTGGSSFGTIDVTNKKGELVPMSLNISKYVNTDDLFAAGSHLGDITLVIKEDSSVKALFDHVSFGHAQINFVGVDNITNFVWMFRESDLTNAEMKPEFVINSDAASIFYGAKLGDDVSFEGTRVEYHAGISMLYMFKNAILGASNNKIEAIDWSGYNIDEAADAATLAANIIEKSKLEGLFDNVTLTADLDISGWEFANSITMQQMAESVSGEELMTYLGKAKKGEYKIIYK